MSGDAERRADWAKFFEQQGMRAIRCAGPGATSCALVGAKRCPLHDEADLIFYDEASVTRELDEQLDLFPPRTPIAYASSVRSPAGLQLPATTRVRPGAGAERHRSR